MISQDRIDEDSCSALGVSKDASAGGIKKAYRKPARKYYLDKSPGDSAAEKRFKEASEAYQVLSSRGDHKQYDAIRAFSVGSTRFTAGGGGGIGFEDIFSSMFGGSGGSSHRHAQRASIPSDGFEDIFDIFGGSDSGGSRSSFGSPHRTSRDKDLITSVSIPLRQATSGTAMKITTASGHSVTVKIPAGVTDGQKIRVPGKDGAGVNGGPDGDIPVAVSVEEHPAYELKSKDMYANAPISFSETVLGAIVKVSVLDGRTVSVKVPEGSSTDKLLRVRGKGPKGGDMYARLKVVVPRKLSGDIRRVVGEFADVTNDAGPRTGFATLVRS